MNDASIESSLFSEAVRYIGLQVSDGSVSSESAAAYKILLLGELFPEDAAVSSFFIKEAVTRLQRILVIFDSSPQFLEDVSKTPHDLRIGIAEAACFAAVAAYAFSMIKRQADAGFPAFFPDSERLFTASIKAGCFLKELLMYDNDFSDADSLCYWAFAELFRLTDCGEWLNYCCRFEDRIMNEDGYAVSAPISRQNMSAAALWALFKKNDAEYYRTQIIMEAENSSCCCLAAAGFRITDKPEKKEEFLDAAGSLIFPGRYQVNKACI